MRYVSYEMQLAMQAKDMLGKELTVGDRVARVPVGPGASASLDICRVTTVENGKVYLDNSKVPLKYPTRLLIVNEVSGFTN